MASTRRDAHAGSGAGLLVCDVDGTILDSSGALRSSVRRAIRAIARSGVDVVLATGRSPWAGVAEIADALGLTGPQVTMQGALVSDVRTGEVHRAVPLGSPLYAESLRFAREHRIDPIVGCLDGHRFERLPNWLRFAGSQLAEGKDARRLRTLDDLAAERPLRVFLPTGPQRHEEVRQQAIARFGESASIVWSDDTGIEILAPGTNKAVAIEWLARERGSTMDAVAAVGDATNDIELLRAAGRSAAMASAPASVRSVADIVVPSADETGTLDAFAWFFPDVALGLGVPSRDPLLRPTVV